MKEWIQKAKEDRPVWISEVREVWEKGKDSFNLIIELTLYNDRKKQWTYYVPVAKDAEEQEFVRRFLYAETYNALAAYSATKVTFYADKNNIELWELLHSIPEKFQCFLTQRNGYGKVVNIARRINRTFGKDVFSFVIKEQKEYIPMSDESEEEKKLSTFLKNIMKREQGGLYAGLDVGGTDVKLAISYHHRLFDAIGISFPDVVIEDRIVGGETPKTKGIREHEGEHYETEFSGITELRTELSSLCKDKAGIPD